MRLSEIERRLGYLEGGWPAEATELRGWAEDVRGLVTIAHSALAWRARKSAATDMRLFNVLDDVEE